jgi:hypothetical protein
MSTDGSGAVGAYGIYLVIGYIITTFLVDLLLLLVSTPSLIAFASRSHMNVLFTNIFTYFWIIKCA